MPGDNPCAAGADTVYSAVINIWSGDLQADLESMSQQRSDSDAAGAELMAHLEEAESRTLAAEEAAEAASQEASAVKQRLDDLQVQSCHKQGLRHVAPRWNGGHDL